MADLCHVAIPALGTMNTTLGCGCQHQESTIQRQNRLLQKLQKTLQTKDKVSAGLMKQTVEWKGIIRKLDNALIKAKKDVANAKVAQLDAETKLEQYRNTYRPQAAAFLHSQYLLSNKVQSPQSCVMRLARDHDMDNRSQHDKFSTHGSVLRHCVITSIYVRETRPCNLWHFVTLLSRRLNESWPPAT